MSIGLEAISAIKLDVSRRTLLPPTSSEVPPARNARAAVPRPVGFGIGMRHRGIARRDREWSVTVADYAGSGMPCSRSFVTGVRSDLPRMAFAEDAGWRRGDSPPQSPGPAAPFPKEPKEAGPQAEKVVRRSGTAETLEPTHSGRSDIVANVAGATSPSRSARRHGGAMTRSLPFGVTQAQGRSNPRPMPDFRWSRDRTFGNVARAGTA